MKLILYKKEISLLLLSAIWLFFLLYLGIADVHGRSYSTQWLIQALGVLVIVFYQTIKRLNKNRLNINSSLYPSLGWGNRFTIIRGIMIAALAGFLFQVWPVSYLAWIPGIIYLIASIIDRLDGYLARITCMQSQLGTELDTVYDAVGLLIAPVLAVTYGQLHWSYLLVSIAYYLFVIGIKLREFRGLRVIELPPNISRRAIAGFQMGFVAVVLLPVFHPPITQIAGMAFMIPLLFGFIIDWFIVRGTISSGTGLSVLLDKLRFLSFNYFLPALRILVVCLTIHLYITTNGNEIKIASIVLASISLVLIITGIIGRIGAVVLSIVLGFYFQDQMLSTNVIVLLFCIIWIMMLGTGYFSLYKRDEDWVNRYDGA